MKNDKNTKIRKPKGRDTEYKLRSNNSRTSKKAVSKKKYDSQQLYKLLFENINNIRPRVRKNDDEVPLTRISQSQEQKRNA